MKPPYIQMYVADQGQRCPEAEDSVSFALPYDAFARLSVALICSLHVVGMLHATLTLRFRWRGNGIAGSKRAALRALACNRVAASSEPPDTRLTSSLRGYPATSRVLCQEEKRGTHSLPKIPFRWGGAVPSSTHPQRPSCCVVSCSRPPRSCASRPHGRLSSAAARSAPLSGSLKRPVSALGHCILALSYCARFHEDDFPNVAIQVLKSMSIHGTVVLWFIVGCSTDRDCVANHFVDFLSALRR